MSKSKEERKKQKPLKWTTKHHGNGLGDNPWLQRADDRHPSSWSRGRIRFMRIPSYVYVLIDRRTGEAYKTKNREMPFYSSVRAIKVGLRNIAAYTDVNNFEVVQYELVKRASLDGSQPVTPQENSDNLKGTGEHNG